MTSVNLIKSALQKDLDDCVEREALCRRKETGDITSLELEFFLTVQAINQEALNWRKSVVKSEEKDGVEGNSSGQLC